ncbi:cell wall hydrolase [bacterium C-53]|nr:cell wall hydrolase [Lachnospiraceae bacterium]NBI01802.1 cell wall hydrolase [Lachnospiraceae bacterium]RKJ12217.1 cell wall hydrolase [bacterium C-53]
MKKLLKRKIHDVSTYVIKNSKRPYRECAILVICTVLLVVSSLSTGYGNPELTSVDTVGMQYKAPAEFSVSEITEEEKEDVLNESRASSKKEADLLNTFETLGSFDAYETIQLLQAVQVLAKEPEKSDRRTVSALPEKTEVVEIPKEETKEILPQEEPEIIDVAMSDQDVSMPESETVELPESMETTVPEDSSLLIDEGMSETASVVAIAEDEMDTQPAEESHEEEISINTMETISADCAADTVETSTCGLSASEYDALCRIVEAEAGTEGEEGKLLVANVVLNRVANPAFPSTIEGVITADGQFSPVQNGRYQRAVATPETLAAVNRALNGENISKGALYFKSVHSTANWGNRTLLYNYRNHNFYQ